MRIEVYKKKKKKKKTEAYAIVKPRNRGSSSEIQISDYALSNLFVVHVDARNRVQLSPR